MSETARYPANVIPFPVQQISRLPSSGHTSTAAHQHEAAMQIAHAAPENAWPGRAFGWLSTLARLLKSRRKTADYHSFDDHILKDMGLTRHHLTWLDSKTFR